MATTDRNQAFHTMPNEDAPIGRPAENAKPVYRSYKYVMAICLAECYPISSTQVLMVDRKKYRKMRLKFDDSMRQSNELYRMEQDANATIKRIAQFNRSVYSADQQPYSC
jgi:hypothetical protein